MEAFFSIAGLLLYILACRAVGRIAKESFFRSQGQWTVLAIVFNPLLAIFFLFIAGPPVTAAGQVTAARQREAEEEAEEYERAEAAVDDAAWKPCPRCIGKYNVRTQEGLGADDEEPWKLVCDRCGADVSDEVRETIRRGPS